MSHMEKNEYCKKYNYNRDQSNNAGTNLNNNFFPRIRWGCPTPALSREMGEKLSSLDTWSSSSGQRGCEQHVEHDCWLY